MHKLIATLALAAAIGSAFAQTTTTETQSTTTSNVVLSPQFQIGPFMTSHNLSWQDAAAVYALSRYTGMTPDLVFSTRGANTSSFYDLAPAFVLANQAGAPVSDVLNMYNTGRTWLDIANSLGVPSIYWNPLGANTGGWTNSDLTAAVWEGLLRGNFGLSNPDVMYIQNLNIPLADQVALVEFSREMNVPVRDVAATYSVNGNQWVVVERQFAYVPPPVVETQQTTIVQTETTSSAAQPFVRTIVREVPVTKTVYVPKTVVKKVYVPRTVKRSTGSRPMRFSSKRRTAKRCICTCPEHKVALAELARLKSRKR
ncbi:MAG TPA: hypothetical protein VK934_06520 [Fimbriimonas sp.]|nr:hypothetical protein [Fimbriimonas sp.]